MGTKHSTVTLYASQTEVVLKTLERDGVCFSKREYVVKKYQESAPVFLAAYDWFVAQAQKHMPRPEGAEFPYWAYQDFYSVDRSADGRVLQLSVPANEAIFFDMYDWIKVLRHQYIGESQLEEKRFKQKLDDYGVRRESDVLLTNFYPDLKNEVHESWQRLFRHNERIRAGEAHGAKSVQAALWQLKKEWIVL